MAGGVLETGRKVGARSIGQGARACWVLAISDYILCSDGLSRKPSIEYCVARLYVLTRARQREPHGSDSCIVMPKTTNTVSPNSADRRRGLCTRYDMSSPVAHGEKKTA